jgi:hypothetical protein
MSWWTVVTFMSLQIGVKIHVTLRVFSGCRRGEMFAALTTVEKARMGDFLEIGIWDERTDGPGSKKGESKNSFPRDIFWVNFCCHRGQAVKGPEAHAPVTCMLPWRWWLHCPLLRGTTPPNPCRILCASSSSSSQGLVQNTSLASSTSSSFRFHCIFE